MPVGVGPEIYMPESETSDAEHREKVKELAKTLLIYARDRSHSFMEKGSLVGKTFLRMAQDLGHRKQSIEEFRQLCDVIEHKHHVDTAPLFSGFVGELAAADLLHGLEEIEAVEFPTLKQDRYEATDWVAKTRDQKRLLVQSKTLGLTQERADSARQIPVLSRVKTIEDLNKLINSLNALCVEDISIIWDRPEQAPLRSRQITPEMLADSYNVSFSAAPDTNLLIDRASQGQSNQANAIEKICLTAKVMCAEHQDDDDVPVICILGGMNFGGSDVNAKMGTPSREAVDSARTEIAEILRDKS